MEPSPAPTLAPTSNPEPSVENNLYENTIEPLTAETTEETDQATDAEPEARRAPPSPNDPNNRLVADGQYYIGLNPNGAPVGRWFVDPDTDEWAFRPEEATSSAYRPIPQTGDNRPRRAGLPTIILITGTLAVVLGIAVKKEINKESLKHK